MDLCDFKQNCIDKVIRDIEFQDPGWFTKGFIKFIVEDPKTGDLFSAKIYIG